MLRHEHLAATTPNGEKWDAILSYDAAAWNVQGELRGKYAWSVHEREDTERGPYDFWNEYIAEDDRAWLKVYRCVPIERVIAIDPLGDGYYPVPHVFVDFSPATGPFSDREFSSLERAGMHGGELNLRPEETNRAAIFPKPLPAEGDPPPTGFDDTGSAPSALSESANAKFAQLLGAIEEARTPQSSSANEASRGETAELKMKPFREWRDNVAMPLFAAFVSRLRAANHSARVVVRSMSQNPNGRQAHESIELRVRVHIGTPFNPSYRPSGHVRVTLSEFGAWQLDVSPSRESSASRHATPPQPKAERMSHEHLEAEVLAMVERLQAGRY